MASHNTSGDEAFRDLSSGMSSHTNTLDRSSEIPGEGPPSGRATLIKHQATDTESAKGRKRFSRRHSKNGLAAVFWCCLSPFSYLVFSGCRPSKIEPFTPTLSPASLVDSRSSSVGYCRFLLCFLCICKTLFSGVFEFSSASCIVQWWACVFLHLDWLEGACIHPSSFLVSFPAPFPLSMFPFLSLSRLEPIYPFLLWNQSSSFLLCVLFGSCLCSCQFYRGTVYKNPWRLSWFPFLLLLFYSIPIWYTIMFLVI